MRNLNLDVSAERQPTLFENDARGPGRFVQCGGRLREALAEALKRCKRFDRYGVAAEMSRLTEQDVSKSSLDAYVAPSRPDMRLPVELLPAFIEATGSAEPLRVLAEICGYELVGAQERGILELARIEARIDELQTKRAQLKPATRRYFEEKEGRR